MFGMIPCVVTTLDDDDCRVQIANTRTYRGAKRLVRELEAHDPTRYFGIHEAWNNPMLRSVMDR